MGHPSTKSHMLKTLMALRAPESHCFLYPSIVGFIESANLPMRGIVHLSPGKCCFLCLYTDCSRTSRAMRMAPVVQSQVVIGPEGKVGNEGMGILERDAPAVDDGIDAEGEKPLK
jgi:hypothetical protein